MQKITLKDHRRFHIRIYGKISKTKYWRVKNAIRRLEKKGFLVRIEFKNGRGGWTNYEVPDDIYESIENVRSKVVANWEQSGTHQQSKEAQRKQIPLVVVVV